MSACLFCKIINGEIPCEKIAESDNFICFLDIKPVNEGHALIVPKQHFSDVTEFPTQIAAEFFTFSKQMAKKIINAVEADGFNLSMNNGAAAGQIIFHQHSHLIPRFSNDGLQSWSHNDASAAQLQALAAKIR